MYKRKGLLIFIGLIIYCFVLKYMFRVIFPFALAILCFFIVKPIIDYMENVFRVKRSAIGVSLLLFIYIIVALFIGCFITYLIFYLLRFCENIPYYYDYIITPFVQQFIEWSYQQFPFLMKPDYIIMIQEFLTQYFIDVMSFFSNFITHIPSFLFSFFLFIISTFFLVLEYDEMKQSFFSLFSYHLKYSFIKVKKQFLKSIGLYMKCQLSLMFVCFIILCLGYFALKIKHFVLYALTTALLDSLPFIGVGIVLIPLTIVYLLQGLYLKAFYVILLYLIINVTRSILEPHFMNKAMRVPSFILLLSMVIHLYFFGLIGVILSPIHMNLIYVMLDIGD